MPTLSCRTPQTWLPRASVLAAFVLLGVACLQAAPIKVWVLLRDKGPAAPHAGQAWENAPLYAPYLTGLRQTGFQQAIALRWQNRVSGFVDASKMATLRALPGVLAVEPMRKARRLPSPIALPGKGSLPKVAGSQAIQPFGVLQGTLAGIGLGVVRDSLAARGLAPGRGLRIAVLDADFFLGNAAFDALRAEGRIVDQYDFVADRPLSVSNGFSDSHGATVLSIIGGDSPGLLQGAAPGAEFLLYRTEEDASETYVEEDYLAAAMERAVDSGAQVVNISLGYRFQFDGQPDLPFSAMDGRTRPSSLAVLMAARRNVLVTVSVGNYNVESESGVQAPGDADSILAVGIADSEGRRCSYSCVGPTADGRTKPDLVGLGPNFCRVSAADPLQEQGYSDVSGTSFSAPALAGAAALLRQGFPLASAMDIRAALLQSATQASHPDDSLGFGVARADLAWKLLAGQSIGLAYGPKKLIYRQAGLPWLLERLPGAAQPSGVVDIQGRFYPATVLLVGDTLRLFPRARLSRGIFFLR